MTGFLEVFTLVYVHGQRLIAPIISKALTSSFLSAGWMTSGKETIRKLVSRSRQDREDA